MKRGLGMRAVQESRLTSGVKFSARVDADGLPCSNIVVSMSISRPSNQGRLAVVDDPHARMPIEPREVVYH